MYSSATQDTKITAIESWDNITSIGIVDQYSGEELPAKK